MGQTGLASLCVLLRYLYPGSDHWRVVLSSWFRPSRASHFLLLAQEKVTKEKGTPTSGPGYAGVPSLHHRSRGTLRRAIPGPSQLSRHPCRSTPSTVIPLGLLKGTWASSVPSQLKSKSQTLPTLILRRFRKLAVRSPSGGRSEGSFAQRNPDVGVPFFGTPFLGKQRDAAQRSNSCRLARRVSAANQGVAPVRGATKTLSGLGNGWC